MKHVFLFILLVLLIGSLKSQIYVTPHVGYSTRVTTGAEVGMDINIISLAVGASRNVTDEVKVPKHVYAKAGVRIPVSEKLEVGGFYLFGNSYSKREVSLGTHSIYSHYQTFKTPLRSYSVEVFYHYVDKADIMIGFDGFGYFKIGIKYHYGQNIKKSI